MKLHLHPELLDRLAASYAVGTLRGPARRRFEALTRENAVIRAAALIWQGRISSLGELQPSVQPAPQVWTRITNMLDAQSEQTAIARNRTKDQDTQVPSWTDWLSNLMIWRATSAAFVVATVVAVSWGLSSKEQSNNQIAQLQIQLQSTQQISYVAVLSDNKEAAAMLVTLDGKSNKLTVQRVGSYREANDKSLQLWALAPSGIPRSLGVLGRDNVIQLTTVRDEVQSIPTLAISLEPLGGVPSVTGPTGPVLFKGTLIQKTT